MTTTIYKTSRFLLLDGTYIEATPLKIKYLKDLMEVFDTKANKVATEAQLLDVIIECVVICMKQYCPRIKTKEELEDVIDVATMYEILDIAAGIKFEDRKSVV